MNSFWITNWLYIRIFRLRVTKRHQLIMHLKSQSNIINFNTLPTYLPMLLYNLNLINIIHDSIRCSLFLLFFKDFNYYLLLRMCAYLILVDTHQQSISRPSIINCSLWYWIIQKNEKGFTTPYIYTFAIKCIINFWIK